MFVKGKATADNAGEMFDLFRLVLTESNLNSKQRVVEMLRETKSRTEAAIQGSGHSYANSRLKAGYSVGGYLDEMMGGLEYYESIKTLLDMAENDFDQLKVSEATS